MHTACGPYDMTAEVERLRTENERLRNALAQLEQWDMLSLRPDGHGAATADAPWARDLIAKALRG